LRETPRAKNTGIPCRVIAVKEMWAIPLLTLTSHPG
jgi:hypothetical protein